MSEPVKHNFIQLPKMPNGEPFTLAHFVARADPHSQHELDRISRLVSEYERRYPFAHSICTPSIPGEQPMTFAEQYKQRLLGKYPWIFGAESNVAFLTTRFVLIL